MNRFYKIKADDFNKMINYFKNKIFDIKVYDANGLADFRRIRGEAC